MQLPECDESLLPAALRANAIASRKKAKPVDEIAPIEGLPTLPFASSTRIPANPQPKIHAKPRAYWVQTAQAFEKGSVIEAIKFFEDAPIDLVVLALATFKASNTSWMAMDIIIRRCGLDAVDLFMKFSADSRGESVRFFRELRSPAIAPSVAAAHAKLKTARAKCEEWLFSNPEAAAIGLIPDAVGKESRRRKDAADALRVLATKHAAVITDVAQRYGGEVPARIAEKLNSASITTTAADARTLLLSKKASLPVFATPRGDGDDDDDNQKIPPVLTRDRAQQLPLSALERICLLAQHEQQEGGAALTCDIEAVKEACDPASLGEFVWHLFDRWLGARLPTNGGWTLTALGAFGDDQVAVRLAPHIRRWPGESRHARALSGIDALVRIGSDVAWTVVYDISAQTPYSGLRSRAHSRLKALAKPYDGDIECLIDRIAPRIGAATPHIKEQVNAITSILSSRLERMMMCRERRVSCEDFMTYVVQHPLLGQLARRLVWGVWTAGQLEQTFRVVEDLTFADVHDEAWLLPTKSSLSSIGIVHPAVLTPDLISRWAKLLAEYKIVQPFAQLDRAIFQPTEDELDATELKRINGRVVTPGRLYGLRRRGWTVLDAGPEDGDEDNDDSYSSRCIDAFAKSIAQNQFNAIITVAPGFFLGSMDATHAQTIQSVRISTCIRHLSAISFSELISDLEALVE